jgi:hypothetical protein
MSDCALFPASPSKNRVWSVWADKESHLSLVGRTFTCIPLRVQPFLFLNWAGVIIYGLITEIHHTTNRTSVAYTVAELPPDTLTPGFYGW